MLSHDNTHTLHVEQFVYVDLSRLNFVGRIWFSLYSLPLFDSSQCLVCYGWHCVRSTWHFYDLSCIFFVVSAEVAISFLVYLGYLFKQWLALDLHSTLNNNFRVRWTAHNFRANFFLVRIVKHALSVLWESLQLWNSVHLQSAAFCVDSSNCCCKSGVSLSVFLDSNSIKIKQRYIYSAVQNNQNAEMSQSRHTKNHMCLLRWLPLGCPSQ